MYPAHLATLNLAAREIVEEANYPRIARQNFFDFDPAKPFCRVPENAGGAITLPLLDAVVGNPPYVRHENVDKADKKRFGQLAATGWPGFELPGRSDLYCYFWPQAARLLKPNGYFGFLTSSSWLDVEYGFALQGWMLRHFRILAVMESAAEPWFTDARVKTCATILQRCEDEEVRMSNRVRFVRFDRKLADIFRVVPGQNDAARQGSVEALRAKILTTETDYHDPDMRIIVKSQRDLWEDGVKAGSVLGGSVPVPAEDDEDEDGEQPSEWWHPKGLYSAGKWGRYLRAPDIYFDIMRRFGQQFVPLGEIATIRYGVKSGCDEFFMPSDVTETKLASYKDDRSFREHCGGAPRKEVQAGKLRIIEDGEGVIHPIEATSIAPEIHSARGVDRPIIKRSEVSRVILLVNSPLDKLKANAPWTWRYIQYGAKTIYTSRKSKPVPVPARSFISKRAVWYNLTDQVKPGIAIWPKGQQYRHLVISNPDALVANCRLYDVAVREECTDAASLVAVLNSTLVALCRNFYGRYTGTEGAMETMVLDALLLEVPNPLFATKKVNTRLHAAFSVLSKRSTGDFVEEQLMECHSPERARRLGSGPLQYANELRTSDRRELDDAVFELLGVADAEERSALIDRLYEATARHFREIRVVEIEKSEQKKKSKSKGINTHDLAADIWDAAELSDTTTLVEWLALQPEAGSAVNIPDERPVELSGDLMYSPNVVYFGKPRSNHQEFASRDRAALVALLGHVGLSGALRLPDDDKPCAELKDRIEARMAAARARFRELAESRTSFEPIREQLVDLCQRWYVHGRKAAKS